MSNRIILYISIQYNISQSLEKILVSCVLHFIIFINITIDQRNKGNLYLHDKIAPTYKIIFLMLYIMKFKTEDNSV